MNLLAHLFFDCCMAKYFREVISSIFHVVIGVNFESVGCN
jgi:hypothetical protein